MWLWWQRAHYISPMCKLQNSEWNVAKWLMFNSQQTQEIFFFPSPEFPNFLRSTRPPGQWVLQEPYLESKATRTLILTFSSIWFHGLLNWHNFYGWYKRKRYLRLHICKRRRLSFWYSDKFVVTIVSSQRGLPMLSSVLQSPPLPHWQQVYWPKLWLKI
jgi:hypothetical protein